MLTPSGRRQLPPLNALRAFEAVARTGSFTRAADELLVTQSAVSRHVKNLEDVLGVELLRRKGQVELTEAGKRLLPALTEALDRIAALTAELRGPKAPPPMLLAIPPTIARRVIVPALARFRRDRPQLEIRVETPATNVDLGSSAFDLAVLHGQPAVAGLIVDLLMAEKLVPVCNAEILAKGYPTLEAMLKAEPLLHIRQQDDDWQDWRGLVARHRLTGINYQRGLVLETADLAVQAAIGGGGIAIVDPRLFESELASGALKMPFAETIPSGRSYFLVSRPEEADLPNHRLLRDWLLAFFGQPPFRS